MTAAAGQRLRPSGSDGSGLQPHCQDAAHHASWHSISFNAPFSHHDNSFGLPYLQYPAVAASSMLPIALQLLPGRPLAALWADITHAGIHANPTKARKTPQQEWHVRVVHQHSKPDSLTPAVAAAAALPRALLRRVALGLLPGSIQTVQLICIAWKYIMQAIKRNAGSVCRAARQQHGPPQPRGNLGCKPGLPMPVNRGCAETNVAVTHSLLVSQPAARSTHLALRAAPWPPAALSTAPAQHSAHRRHP